MCRRKGCIEGAKLCIRRCKNYGIIRYNVRICQVVQEISKNEDSIQFKLINSVSKVVVKVKGGSRVESALFAILYYLLCKYISKFY